MKLDTWIKIPEYENGYGIVKKFGDIYYCLTYWVEDDDKKSRFWIQLSSGKKRKHLENFDPDSLRRGNGVAPLFWAKNEMYKGVKSHIRSYPDYVDVYIVISWADAQRGRVYSRLEKEGFHKGTVNGSICLIKKLER